METKDPAAQATTDAPETPSAAPATATTKPVAPAEENFDDIQLDNVELVEVKAFA